MKRSTLLPALWLAALAVSCNLAADGFPRVPPTPPENAEATFEVLHGFRMELIAAEPLVASPVDLAYDEEGRAYVVEMRDYPFPEEKNVEPTVFEGTVRLLEDTDGDGKFDKSTIFADTLAWPTSVCCYKGGVFVAAAPDIWYFKDTDGDRQADVRRKVFTGFSRYNVQAIMNSLRWGLDNKIYGSASGNGGAIKHADRPDDQPLSLARRDFRFDPVTEKIEPISGGERYGACFDDWGNRFLCNIRNPVQHVVLPLHYLARNPYLVVPSVIHDAAESGDQLRVYRLSPPEPWREFRAQRWALEGQNMPRSELIGAGYWTSSSGVCVYRGGAYPEPFRGNVFIGEVAGNLIHRQILERDGVTFKSRRADENTEFVRSRDNWFRPVNFINAPDGTLTVLDMYRETIEHPWSIPDDIKSQLDLSSGKDRGRLYRLAPPGFQSTSPPKLSSATSTDLVKQLSNPHSWYRETAQRLLFERQDKKAVPLLHDVVKRHPSPRGKLHALYALDGMHALTATDVQLAVRERVPDLMRNAIQLSEHVEIEHGAIIDLLDAALLYPASSLHFQVALSLGTFQLPADDTVRLLAQCDLDRTGEAGHAEDPWMLAAILSSAGERADALLKQYLDRPALNSRRNLIRQLASMMAASSTEDSVLRTLAEVANKPRIPNELMLGPVLSGFSEGLARKKLRLDRVISGLKEPTQTKLREQIDRLTKAAGDASQPAATRIAAIDLRRHLDPSDNLKVLVACLEPTGPPEVQRASLRVLASFNQPDVAWQLVPLWKRFSPPFRDEAVTILLSRPLWHEPLIAALERGDIPISQVSIPQRTRLAAIKDEKLAARVKTILANFVLGPRKEVIDKYQPALALAGDGPRGQLVYRRECANCHKLRGEGHDVGPSLETIQHRSPQEILIHVLDPNREVSPNFLDYSVRLADGRILTGMIAGETDAGLTLRRAQNQEDTILRTEIEDIAASGKSLMPEGLEQKINPQEMADLIRYLRIQ